MRFHYQARNKEGEIKQGFVVAAAQEKAEAILAENGLIIIGINAQEENFFEKLNPFGRHVSYKDLVLFSRQLSTLIAARVPILQALRILEAQIPKGKLLNVMKEIIGSVENGESFSLALANHPEVFGNVYVSLVRSGEASGSVSQALAYLADQLEKDYALRSKVKSALTYPTFILVALVGVGLMMFKFVLPKLTAVLEEQGGQLPFVSIILIAITHFVEKFWWAVILFLAALVLGDRYYINTPAGRHNWDLFKVRVPLFKTIFQQIYMARFSRNLSTLLAGGIPIIQAIKIVSEVVNNVVYRDILIDVASKVANGNSISDSLGDNPEFPPLVTQMVRVGEQSGQLSEILNKLAVYYEGEVDQKVGNLSTLLEPIIMVILGVVVGGLVAGILLPIYNLASTAG